MNPKLKMIFFKNRKNLFDKENLEIGTITVAGIKYADTTRIRNINPITIDNLTKTIKASVTSIAGKTFEAVYAYYYASGIFLSYVSLPASGILEIPVNANQVSFVFRFTDNSNITVQNAKDGNVQLELGFTATFYEPYRV